MQTTGKIKGYMRKEGLMGNSVVSLWSRMSVV